jgi:hypothetical protein
VPNGRALAGMGAADGTPLWTGIFADLWNFNS